MLKIKIGENEYPIDKFGTFTTQFGNNGIRIVGDVPLAENGFELYDDDVLIGDMSNYKYLLREDDKCKEYTEVEEQIVPCESFLMGDVPPSAISRQISSLNRRVSEITPFTMSKTVGIQDTECVFDGEYKDGVISATVVTSKGEYIPCTVEKSSDNIAVRFKELEEVATVNISIQ